jgi:Pyruvate/2-oxoacid:ferredoxin oxidoreductase delta subunit
MGKRIDAPTYEGDRVGTVERWDKRDILFARADTLHYFGPGSPEYQRYYEAHPEYLDYDQKMARLGAVRRTGKTDHPMVDAQYEPLIALASDAFAGGEPADSRISLSPAQAAAKVEAVARYQGADLVGIGPLRQAWTYTHIGRSFGDREGFPRWGSPIDLSHHPHAIALGFGMDHELIQCAPEFPVNLTTSFGYARAAWTAIRLAEYIRRMGYAARAHYVYNYQLLCIPVAVDCGLGELSRAGLLITKEFGLALQLAVVTTDMPLAYHRPVDLAAQSFCETCEICAEQCPVDAIPRGGKTPFNGIKKWKLDEQRCYHYWQASGTGCSLCVATCPWTQPRTWPHRIAAEFATRKGPHQRFMAQAGEWLRRLSGEASLPDFVTSD